MLGWLKKKKVTPSIPARTNLEEWWLSTFTETERDWMVGAYAPMGIPVSDFSRSIPKHILVPSFYHLAIVATWFSKPGYEHCALAFVQKAMDFYAGNMPILDRHFGLYSCSQVFYRWRNVVSGALDKAIDACERCVSFHEDAAVAFMEKHNTMPMHPCFNRLRIIEEKRGNYDRALEICFTASRAGWVDDWPRHIARIERKREKRLTASQPITS